MENTPNTKEAQHQATEYLTIEKVKQCKGYEHATDQQALAIIHTITALCQIAAKTLTQLGKQ